MPPDYSIILLYYVLGTFSILGSIYVLMALHHMGFTTATTRLMGVLHFTILMQNVFSFPYVYNYNTRLCSAVGFFRTYFSIANAVVIAIFSLHYRQIFFPDKYRLTAFFLQHRRKIIFLLPLLTLIPFAHEGYGQIENGFCSIKTDDDDRTTYSIILYYFLVVIVVGFTIIQILYTIIKVYLYTDLSVASSLASSAGLYVFVSVFTWIPRFASRAGNFSYFDVGYFEYIAALGYYFIFMKEEDSISVYEKNAQRNLSMLDESEEGMQWDFSHISDLLPSAQSARDLLSSIVSSGGESARNSSAPSEEGSGGSLPIGSLASIRRSVVGVIRPSAAKGVSESSSSNRQSMIEMRASESTRPSLTSMNEFRTSETNNLHSKTFSSGNNLSGLIGTMGDDDDENDLPAATDGRGSLSSALSNRLSEISMFSFGNTNKTSRQSVQENRKGEDAAASSGVELESVGGKSATPNADL